ncbi:MAG: O-antigen ligase domain-containing protein [Gammaproteobacteria bacterium]|nr:O-antigen ligase domain-containing protein [Gammaproteobacteria bacterium]
MSQNLWLGLAALVSIVCLFWLVWDMRRQPLPHILVFAVFAIFFRFLLSAFHPYTFPPLAGPLSINALYSAGVIGLGFLLIDHRLLRLRFLLPVYGLLVLIMASAFYNDTQKDSIDSLLKWLFFVVIALAVYESVIRAGRALTLEKLFKSFCIPTLLQLLSVVVGYSKFSESDHSVSYVGGYHHEAVFSVIMITALMLSALRQTVLPGAPRSWSLLPLVLAMNVALTNYRTNILSMLLPLWGYLYVRFLRRGAPLAKVFAALVLTAGVLLVAMLDFSALVDRFAEIGTVMDESAKLIKSPLYYTEWEKDYFSARVYIWSQYIDAYVNSNGMQHLIGMGADSWEHQFRIYAHNTFVSYLFELGLLGCSVIAYFFLRNMARCFNGPLTTYSLLLFLCFLGFLVMNLGTMPLWQVEGMILFAILNALAWELNLTGTVPAPAATGPDHQVPVLTQPVSTQDTMDTPAISHQARA